MDEKKIRALLESIERMMGNPIEADASEIEALFAEFGDGKPPAQTVFNLASKAAQKYRSEGVAVPTHVAEALNATKRALPNLGPELGNASAIVEAALHPIFGPVQQVSYAFRNRSEGTLKDSDLLEKLSREVKRDWSEDEKE